MHEVVIPGVPRFDPYALTINTGDTVRWINRGAVLHSVTSVDEVNSIREISVNRDISPNTTYDATFNTPGLWVYYCKYHSGLDEFNQPVAPGCGAAGLNPVGITSNLECTSRNLTGNFGTPMTGVIAVVSAPTPTRW